MQGSGGNRCHIIIFTAATVMVSICKSLCLHLGDNVHLQVMVLTNLKEEEVKVVVTQRAGQARQEYLTYHILYMIYISYIPDICHFFSTDTIFGSIFLHTKARKSRQNRFSDKTA